MSQHEHEATVPTDQATPSTPSGNPAPPKRPAPPLRPAAAVWTPPEVAVAPVRVTGDPVVIPASLTPPEAVASNVAPAPAPKRRGAHVCRNDPLLDGVSGAHARRDDPLLAGLHVRADEPLAATSLEVHVTEADALVIVVNGAHVTASDPLAVEVVAAQATIDEALVWMPVVEEPPQVLAEPARPHTSPSEPVTGGHGASAKVRRRRWRLVPVAGAAAALAAGLGAGGAYAYFIAKGSGTGHTATGSPVSVTVTATSGAADLLPGRAGAAYFTLHNTNPFAATFNVVATGATVVSNNTIACPSSNVSIAPALPYALSPALTVSAGATTGPESIPGLVKLAATAPSSCQGVTFKVTLTLTGRLT
jgi:hypothetical protein